MDYVSTTASVVAALAAVAALLLAYLTLREARATVKPLQDIVANLQTAATEEKKLLKELRGLTDTTRRAAKVASADLHEGRAARYVDRLLAVAAAVEEVSTGIDQVLGERRPPDVFRAGMGHLRVALAGLPGGTCQRCEELASQGTEGMAAQFQTPARVEVDGLIKYAIAGLQAAQAEEAALVGDPE